MPEAGELLKLIKVAAVRAVNASNPVALIYGTVATTSPLSVRLNEQATLSDKVLSSLYGTEFEVGDRVAMLRVQGGGSYFILGKVA